MTVYYSGAQGNIDRSQHGDMYQSDNAVVTTISAVDTWTEVANFSEGETDGFTFASNAMTAVYSGEYELNWHCSALAAAANTVFEFAVSVNDVIQNKFKIQRKFSTTTDAGAMAGVGMLDLNANDVIKFEVQNITDGNNITIVNCVVMLHRV